LHGAVVEIDTTTGGSGTIEGLDEILATENEKASIGFLDAGTELAAGQIEWQEGRCGDATVGEGDHRQEGFQTVGQSLACAFIHHRHVEIRSLRDDLRCRFEQALVLAGGSPARALYKVIHHQPPDLAG